MSCDIDIDNIENQLIRIDPEESVKTSYDNLIDEVNKVSVLFADIHELVKIQQEYLNRSEDIIQQTENVIIKVEKDLAQGSAYKSGYTRLKIIVSILAGTIVGASFGSIGLLVGGGKICISLGLSLGFFSALKIMS
jgi:copper chaperone CopZ